MRKSKTLLGTAMLFMVLLAAPAEARKFDFKSERLATYMRGTLGYSYLSDKAFNGAGPADVTYDNKVDVNYGGEFGVLIAMGSINLRIAGELIIPKRLTDMSGTNASSVKMFTLDSRVQAIVPELILEYVAQSSPTSKILMGVGGGLAFVDVDNRYFFTAEGTAAYNLQDFTQSARGTTNSFMGYIGWEFLFTDSVTMMLDLGYRQLVIDNLKYKNDHVGFNGSKRAGDPMVNVDGSVPRLDLGGPFGGLSFRFYVPL